MKKIFSFIFLLTSFCALQCLYVFGQANLGQTDSLPHGLNGLAVYERTLSLFWPVVAIIFLMLVFGLYYFLNKRKNSKKIDIVKVEDPLESIPRAIKYLKPKEPFLRKEQEEFFFHLSMNFRQIIEHTSEIKATDQTFKELKPSLKHNSFFNTNSSIDDILTFLERAEFIKFAEKDVTIPEAQQQRDRVSKMVDIIINSYKSSQENCDQKVGSH